MVTTLSRIWLNPLRAGGQRLLGSPQRLHAAVLGGFPSLSGDDRVLWRLETTKPHRPTVLVLGPGTPDWCHLVEQAGWPSSDADQVRIADYRPLLDQVLTGREFRFRLRANPVQNVRPAEAGPDGRFGRYTRVGHRTEAHQRQWLLERAARHGFELAHSGLSHAAPGLEVSQENCANVAVSGRDRLSFSKSDGRARVVVQTTTFDGVLVVTDATALRAALVQGIGPAKAYGCGLLTLAPLSNTRSDGVVAG